MTTRLTIAAALIATFPFLGLSAAQAGTSYNQNDPNGGYGGIGRPVPRGLKRQPAASQYKKTQLEKKNLCVATARRNHGSGELIPSTRSLEKAHYLSKACNRAMNECKRALRKRKSKGKNPIAKCVVVRKNKRIIPPLVLKPAKRSCVATARRNGGNGKTIPATRKSHSAIKQGVACNRALNACRTVLRRRQNNGKNPYAKCVVVRRNGHAVVQFNKGGNSRKYRCVATARRAGGSGKKIPSTRSSKVAGKQGVACNRALNGCKLVLLNRKANGKNKFAKCIVTQRAVVN